MSILKTNYRKHQRFFLQSANVNVNSGANSPNVSLSCTGAFANIPFDNAQLMMIPDRSGAVCLVGVINASYSDGYIYASALTSDGGVVTTSAACGFMVFAVIGSY